MGVGVRGSACVQPLSPIFQQQRTHMSILLAHARFVIPWSSFFDFASPRLAARSRPRVCSIVMRCLSGRAARLLRLERLSASRVNEGSGTV